MLEIKSKLETISSLLIFLVNNRRRNLTIVCIFGPLRFEVGFEAAPVEHVGLSKLVYNYGNTCQAHITNSKVKPLVMRLRIGVRPYIKVINTVLFNHVLQVAIIKP